MKNVLLTAVLLFMTFTLIIGLEYSFSEADSLNIPYGYDEVLYDRISQEEVHFFKWGIESQILTVKHFSLNKRFSFSEEEIFAELTLPSSEITLADLNFLFIKFEDGSFHLSISDRLDSRSNDSNIDYLLRVNSSGEFVDNINIKDIDSSYIYRKSFTFSQILLGAWKEKTPQNDSHFKVYLYSLTSERLIYWGNIKHLLPFKIYSMFFATHTETHCSAYGSSLNLFHSKIPILHEDYAFMQHNYSKLHPDIYIRGLRYYLGEPTREEDIFLYLHRLEFNANQLLFKDVIPVYQDGFIQVDKLSFFSISGKKDSTKISYWSRESRSLTTKAQRNLDLDLYGLPKAYSVSSGHLIINDVTNSTNYFNGLVLNTGIEEVYSNPRVLDDFVQMKGENINWFNKFGRISGDGSYVKLKELVVTVPQDGYEWLKGYPNPFSPNHPSTTLDLNLEVEQEVHITIYNIKGKKIRTLMQGQLPAGLHSFKWDGKDDNKERVASGVYFWKIQTGNYSRTSPIILL